jgi:hypothetical protein
MKIALLGRFASVKFFIFILVYLKDLWVISPDVLSTTTYGYQTAIAFGLNSSGGHRGANDLVSEFFRHVTGHHSSVRNQNFGRPGHRSHCVRTAQNGTVHPYLYGYGEQPYYKLKPFQSSLKITNRYGLGNNSENKREVQKKNFKNSKTKKFWKEFGKSQNVQPFAYVCENWTKIF